MSVYKDKTPREPFLVRYTCALGVIMMVEDSKKLEQVLLGLGIILLIVAAFFARAASVPERSSLGYIAFPSSDGACGFAIAAGLCFVSAAIIHTKRPG